MNYFVDFFIETGALGMVLSFVIFVIIARTDVWLYGKI